MMGLDYATGRGNFVYEQIKTEIDPLIAKVNANLKFSPALFNPNRHRAGMQRPLRGGLG